MLSTFKRTERVDSQPTSNSAPAPVEPARPPVASNTVISSSAEKISPQSIIGQDVEITGVIISKGYLRLDGHVDADIRAHKIYIGATAKVIGSVFANDIEVRGYVEGTIHGAHVCLGASSHVDGDIFHATLSIEEGAYFEGKCRRVSAESYTSDIVGDQVEKIRATLEKMHGSKAGTGNQSQAVEATAPAIVQRA